jgi:GTPase
MIQGEVVISKDGEPQAANKEPEIIYETPLLGNFPCVDENGDEANEEKNPDDFRLAKPGVFTRCELTIHRVETHLLDPSPLSLSEIAKSMEQSAESEINKLGQALEKENLQDQIPMKTPQPDSPTFEKNSVSEALSSRNIRVAVVGNVDAGKSTLIGTLTTSCLDDGRGKSRTSIMKHRHEIESGRTSTATTHLMGFNSTGQPIAGRDQIRANKRKSEDEVARESYRIITLMDLAGHEKYLKTTIHGVSSGFADYALILVNSRQPPTHMTQHHLNLCSSFGIPVVVVFTKIDGCPEHAYKTSKTEVAKLLRAPDIGKTPYLVRNEQDIATCTGKLHTLAPMIETSCVTGQGIDLLQKLLFALPKRRRHEKKLNRSFEFLVEDIFNVPGVGGVVSGFVNAGELTVGASSYVYVGPTDDGSFMKTVAKSAHIARINTHHVQAGQSACLAFSLNKELRKKLRRGMVVLKESPTSTKEFDAEICVLKGEGTTIRRSYQAYVHILNVRQSAYARNIEIVHNTGLVVPGSQSAGEEEDGIVLRPGSRAKVRFEFAKRPVSNVLFVSCPIRRRHHFSDDS